MNKKELKARKDSALLKLEEFHEELDNYIILLQEAGKEYAEKVNVSGNRTVANDYYAESIITSYLIDQIMCEINNLERFSKFIS